MIKAMRFLLFVASKDSSSVPIFSYMKELSAAGERNRGAGRGCDSVAGAPTEDGEPLIEPFDLRPLTDGIEQLGRFDAVLAEFELNLGGSSRPER